jgi:hypothetical protein
LSPTENILIARKKDGSMNQADVEAGIVECLGRHEDPDLREYGDATKVKLYLVGAQGVPFKFGSHEKTGRKLYEMPPNWSFKGDAVRICVALKRLDVPPPPKKVAGTTSVSGGGGRGGFEEVAPGEFGGDRNHMIAMKKKRRSSKEKGQKMANVHPTVSLHNALHLANEARMASSGAGGGGSFSGAGGGGSFSGAGGGASDDHSVNSGYLSTLADDCSDADMQKGPGQPNRVRRICKNCHTACGTNGYLCKRKGVAECTGCERCRPAKKQVQN